MNTPPNEQETTIILGRRSSRAIIYTCDSTMITKLDHMIQLQDTEWKLEKVYKWPDGSISGKEYSCPKNLISFRKKTKNGQLQK